MVKDLVSSLSYLPSLCNICGWMFLTVPSSLDDWEDIFVNPFISIIKLEVSSINFSHSFQICSWLCVWGGCTIIFCQSLHIYIYIYNQGFYYYCAVYNACNTQQFWRSYLFVCTLHYLIIIIKQTYLMALNTETACQVNSVEWVSKIKSIPSIIFYAVHFQLTHFPYDDCEIMCTLSYYHHQIRNMNL